ncbi:MULTISPECIES: HP1 family phage holin [unclassified Serratia (in: enterobacteria)]|uniref:HP1 family phage holin n=1 Tax=unclassified Serratia (in: enterobacteria) TaxID=2647522 RepID=UPI00050560E1|nr:MULTISPECIES: HP1 family phage holin [unclassified Serratia (in: enterobacteria)]KFK93366.1 primosomal protein [Serratia sp. Ag2]KFK98367.1 primosomal protein [Serratia sp. Ag1]
MEKITSYLAYAVAVGLAWVGKYSAQDIALSIGAAVGVGTFAVNWYYRRKSYLLLKRAGVQREVIDVLNR